MSSEENKAIARRWSEELWSKGELAIADEIVAPNYVRHDPGDPFEVEGPEGVKRLVGGARALMPDLYITIDDVIAEGDKVVSRYTGTGTVTGEFMGRAFTEKQNGIRPNHHMKIQVVWTAWKPETTDVACPATYKDSESGSTY